MIEITHAMLDGLRASVAESMSPKRLRHTLAVEVMTERLCALFCPELTMPMRAAALLHDCTKELDLAGQEALCRELGLSKKRLYAVSHKNFGMPIGEHISALRVGEAKRLLESTDLPIGQIAAMVGIQDYHYFAKFFKLRVGTSPLKYRKGFPFILHEK